MRQAFTAELEQLRLQVELMGVRVDENLERMPRGARAPATSTWPRVTVEADDQIDAMNVSLTERCYDLLSRESPVAGDLRFVVSVLRVLSELERIGDLALRVVKLAPDWELLHGHPATFDILRRRWPTPRSSSTAPPCGPGRRQDLGLAAELADNRPMEAFTERFSRELLGHRRTRRRAGGGAYAGGGPVARPHRRPRRHHRGAHPLPDHRRSRPTSPPRSGDGRHARGPACRPAGRTTSSSTSIKGDIVRMAAMVTEGIPRATQVLLDHDLGGAQAIIDGDDPLDALALETEEQCYAVFALQQPMAGDLRGLITARPHGQRDRAQRRPGRQHRQGRPPHLRHRVHAPPARA